VEIPTLLRYSPDAGDHAGDHPLSMARRILWPAVAVLLVTLVAPASGHAVEPPYSNADNWAFADGIMRHLDSWWDADRNAYILRGTPSVRVNSALLLTHAIAARTGYRVLPLTAPRAATLTVVAVARQPTNPYPGQTLRVEFGSGSTLAARIEPSGGPRTQ
jgi:DNA-binding transcriptional LysR family regulator